MVLSFLSLALTAYAATCSLTSITNRAFAVGCAAGASMVGGTTCKVSCLKLYKPTIATLTCSAAGALTPTSFQCIPIAQALFPWKSSQCTSGLATGTGFAGYSYATLSSTAVVASGDDYKLTTSVAATNDKGMAVYGPMRTRGGRQNIEISFQFEYLAPTSASQLGDGVWVMLTTAVPSTSGLTKPALSDAANGIIALEFDFYQDASYDNTAAPHIAVLVASAAGALTETHTAANNLVYPITAPGASTWKQANLLIAPVVGSTTSVVVTAWYDGLTYLRDVLTPTSTPAATAPLMNLFLTRQQIYAVAYSYQRGATTGVSEKHVRYMQVCGVERPQYWSRLYVPGGSRVRNCAQVTSFGNPDPVRIGVWKPFPCPGGVVRAAPLAPTVVAGAPISPW